MSNSLPEQNERSERSGRDPGRWVPIVLFALILIFVFVGGTAALLYWLFSEYSGVRNIWILFCGAPVVLIILAILIIANLYSRFGKPLEGLFKAIDAVGEGNLSVRVPENSDMYSNLIQRFNRMVEDLERAEQQRRNLTADIAHELRTPLHIIRGNLEGLIDGIYQPTAEHINATLDETLLLTRLVNDLQTLSLAETGHLPLHLTRFALADLAADLLSSFSSQAASQGIELKTRLANPDQQITADYDRLNQVMSNLISNALRHTPRGGSISIETGAEPDERGRVQISVKDTGAGIPSKDLPFVFDRFWRGDRSRSERTHSGLGLAITRQLVMAHGGTIEVQSIEGLGTSFLIEIPEHGEEGRAVGSNQ